MYFRIWICCTSADMQRRHYITFRSVNFLVRASSCLKWVSMTSRTISVISSCIRTFGLYIAFHATVCNKVALMNAAIICSLSHYWSPGISYFALRAWLMHTCHWWPISSVNTGDKKQEACGKKSGQTGSFAGGNTERLRSKPLKYKPLWRQSLKGNDSKVSNCITAVVMIFRRRECAFLRCWTAKLSYRCY